MDFHEALIAQTEQEMALKENDKRIEIEPEKGIPLIPMRGICVFPGMVIHFDIGRKKSIQALEAALTKDQLVILAEQKDENAEEIEPADVYSIGCLARVKQTLKMPNGIMRVLVDVKDRAIITDYVSVEPHFVVLYEKLYSIYLASKENDALLRLIRTTFSKYIKMTRRVAGDFAATIESIDDPNRLVDIIAANLELRGEEAQSILREIDLTKRLMQIYQILIEEIEMAEIEQNIDKRVKSELDKNQREYVLREQLRVIQEELGDGNSITRIENYREQLDALDVSDEVREKVETEINRLAVVPSGSSEAGVIETYIEWILDLPWNTESKEEVKVAKVRKILDRDHYGLDNVKERILEYISVLELSQSLKSPIICLVGPPGVGKTSIAKSIAEALNRKYIRMSLGGMRDEAEIRGHRRTYIGAIPGRIIYHLKQAGTKNPLILLDEIDKMSQDFRGDPASALLEVLDPEQNNTFTDNYLELPFDLSKVLFLTTANSLSTIPRPLLDRMEVIEVNGYVEDEKIEIAKRYLVPKQAEIHGLTKDIFKLNRNTIREIIEYYTRESGVRELERKIARVCRVAAKKIVEGSKESISVTPKSLPEYLGKHKYSFDRAKDQKEVGLVNGLAWTSVGGETLEIEVAVLEGKGEIVITGQLGDVMKESAKTAISYIRSQAERFGIAADFHKTKDIHIHVPEGAVPKDGPSAGITMTTALFSALTGKAVPQDLAMTGEITLRGRVLPIGGLREKLTAAHRAGIKMIILPKENEKDLEEVPRTVIDALSIHSVSKMDEVLRLVFGEVL